MEMLIVHDGQRGQTRKAAEAMTRTAVATGAEATVERCRQSEVEV